MVISHRRLDFSLNQTRVSSEEGQLGSVQHLLFFLDFFGKLLQTLTVKSSKARVLSGQPLRLLAQKKKLGVEWFLQIFHVIHDIFDAFVKVLHDFGDSFGDVLLDAAIIVFFLVQLVVLEGAHFFCHGVDLDISLVFLLADFVGHCIDALSHTLEY